MKLICRTFTGSKFVFNATRSMIRSIEKVASGRPAPRYAATGVVFVTTVRNPVETCGIL